MLVFRELKIFEGFVEEKFLRIVLKDFEFYDFVNFVIEICNVLKLVFFVNVDVVLQLMYLELFKEKVYSVEIFEELDVGNIDVGYIIVVYD